MKKINITFFISFLLGFIISGKSQSLRYQNDSNLSSFGIGILQKNKISFKGEVYLDSNFQKTYADDILIGESITPLLYKPDYGICFFICFKCTKTYFIIKNNNGINIYIKKTDAFTFFMWEDFLCNQVIGISTKEPSKNPPRYNINGKVINIEFWDNDDEQDILEIKGDWIKIKNINQKVIYWIKWKEGNMLLVYLNMLI